jgi:hypothetical protein
MENGLIDDEVISFTRLFALPLGMFLLIISVRR